MRRERPSKPDRFADLHFDDDALREMRYAALLHDFGKVAVPEYIFGKAKKLPDGKLDTIRLRFLLAINQVETLGARRKFELLPAGAALDDQRMLDIEADTTTRAGELQALLTTVESANEPRVVAADVGALLDSILGKTYLDLEEERPLLDDRRVRLPARSRAARSPTTNGKRWSSTSRSRFISCARSRGPRRRGATFPTSPTATTSISTVPATRAASRTTRSRPQVRMLTIADVYDALTAKDRPYKAAMPVDRALDILVKEFAAARQGRRRTARPLHRAQGLRNDRPHRRKSLVVGMTGVTWQRYVKVSRRTYP